MVPRRPLSSFVALARVCVATAVLLACDRTGTTSYAFQLSSSRAPLMRRPAFVTTVSSSTTQLEMAKKSKAASTAALDALEVWDDEPDQVLSKKEQLKLARKQAMGGGGSSEEPSVESTTIQLSAKELKLQRALEMEVADDARRSDDDTTSPGLSKKELKELKKKEEKLAAKLAKKQGKKQLRSENDDDEDEEDMAESSSGAVNGETSVDTESTDLHQLTLEDKIRRERPPPRIRVMESSQPGYTSLRLENVGITFRNQEVLKDVTWGVQTGDRIGLVGANGAGTCAIILLLVCAVT